MLPAPPLEKLRTIEAVIFDCDGVLTPGDLFYDERGGRMLRFNARDGFGLAALTRGTGLRAGVLSGRPTDIAEARCKELGLAPFVGDDLPDLQAFSAAGLKIAVADAAPEVIDAADWVTTKRGGKGAVREVCEGILKARGDWARVVARCGG